MTDLETAIQQYQEAIDATPADHPDRARRLQSLGIGYHDRYQRTGATANLETAIERFREAVDATSADHPDRADRLQSLGIGYGIRYRRTKATADLEAAIQQYQEALDSISSPVNNRLRPGKLLFTLNIEIKNWLQAYQTASKLVSPVPLLTPRSLETSDKQHLLTDLVGLASDAAATALNAARIPFDAIQLLELGRGVITGSLNEMRLDIFELQQKHPQYAKKYIHLRDQFDTPKTSTQFQVDQRHKTAYEFEKLVQEIRTLHGFDRFLLAPSEDELKTAAKYGPIVIINVSDHRCDAMIIENHQIRVLRLSRLHSNDIRDRIKNNLADLEILEWLWDTIAQPVLDALGLPKPLYPVAYLGYGGFLQDH